MVTQRKLMEQLFQIKITKGKPFPKRKSTILGEIYNLVQNLYIQTLQFVDNLQ